MSIIGGCSSVGRAPDCGSGRRGFKSRRSPFIVVKLHPWLNWIEHWTSNPKVAGSNPAGCETLVLYLKKLFKFCILPKVCRSGGTGRHARLRI